MGLKAVLRIFLLFSGAACLSATTISRSGTFTSDDNVVLIPFTLSADSNILIQTTSFADGSLGFEPVLTVFDSMGNLLLQDATGGTTPSGCGGRAVDAVSGFCLDGLIQNVLIAGGYTLALSEYDNIPGGPTLGDGFPQTGNGDFTGPEFLGAPGAFVLFDGEQRTGEWALSISAANATLNAPEPTAFGLVGAALLTAGMTVRRRKSTNP